MPVFLFLSISRPPPLSTLFPYTTLFRSVLTACELRRRIGRCSSQDFPSSAVQGGSILPRGEVAIRPIPCGAGVPRSEEHTSELQSHHDLVCRLLLEKKKK